MHSILLCLQICVILAGFSHIMLSNVFNKNSINRVYFVLGIELRAAIKPFSIHIINLFGS